VGILVVDVDEEGKFKKFVDWGNAPLLGDRWRTLNGSLVSFHGDATADRVRTGNARGKLIFKFAGGADHPLCRAGAKWKKARGIEVFYGNGMPSILGQYGDNGDQYRLEGTLGEVPDWLIESLIPRPPKASAKKKGASRMTPEAQQEALKKLPSLLAERCPELGNPSVGWRLKDLADGREIFVGRCPFEHDSGESDDGDLSAGYHEDGPWVRCMYGSCAQIQTLNRRLKEEHQGSQPRKSQARKPRTRRQESPPRADEDTRNLKEAEPVTAEITEDATPPPAEPEAETSPPTPSGDAKAATPPPSSTSTESGESQAQMLLRLASVATFFHSADGRAYASVPINGHVETHEFRSSGFKQWLTHAFFLEQRKPPSSDAMQGARGVLEARAFYDGACELVFIRVAPHGDSAIYVDLGDSARRAVEIRPDGWSIVSDPAVRFLRPKGMKPLPEPARGGSLKKLRTFARLDEDQFLLVVAWLVAALWPAGPYPVLVLTGEQGSGKSTLAMALRRLCDPHMMPLRSPPREPKDLVIGARHNRVLAINNISTIPVWLSDGLCQLSSGGGFASRTLYENDEETLLEAQLPVILNGIEDFVDRGDLKDRSLYLHLRPMPEEGRRTEVAFWKAVDAELPKLLGALFDAVSGGLKKLPEVNLSAMPRMADFAKLGEAVSLALGHAP
jgi:hypothetical protein